MITLEQARSLRIGDVIYFAEKKPNNEVQFVEYFIDSLTYDEFRYSKDQSATHKIDINHLDSAANYQLFLYKPKGF